MKHIDGGSRATQLFDNYLASIVTQLCLTKLNELQIC